MIRSPVRGVGHLRASLALYARTLAYARTEWRLLLLTVSAMLGATLLTLGRPWPMQVVVDTVLGAEPAPAWITAPLGALTARALLTVAIALMVALLVANQLISMAQAYCSQLLGQRMVLALRRDLYAKLHRLELRFHDHSSVGDLIYRITGDAAALQDVVIYGVIPAAIQVITAAAIAATILALDVRLGLVALALVPVLVAWTVWSSERVKRRSRLLKRAESSLYTVVSEVLGSIRAVKSFAMEDVELDRFATRARSSQREYVRVMTLSMAVGLVTEVVAGLGTIAVIALGALAVLSGELSVGRLLVFIAYLQSLYGPVTHLARSALIVQKSGASLERVAQVLDEPEEHAGGAVLPGVAGRVSYQGVSFGYDGTRAAVREVSLDVEPGEMVAFVGRSGAGKTTLFSLLLRFYRPESGRILLDGVDVESLDLRWLRRQIALVLQEPIIFSSSLGENVAYGRPGAGRDAIVAASRAAGLHEFVAELPEGYDTPVGERGVRLSGGQRQRLSIARAFLKDAPILLLDEPTASLDATTEQHVFASLEHLAQGRTTLLVAHRLATAQRADRIVVLESGRVVEHGTHGELLPLHGAYARLWRDQMGGHSVPSSAVASTMSLVGASPNG